MEIEARLDAAQLAHKHLLDYRLRIGADFLMSRYWVEKETQSPLNPVGSTTSGDILACHACGRNFFIPG